jgi:hypothetical protein
MRNNPKTLIIFALLGIIFICAAPGFAQSDETVVGGYRKIETTNAQAVAAANFAVKSQSKKQKAKIKLLSISRAEQQVVAGMNYNLCLQIEVREKGKKTAVPQTVQTVVFLDLKQKYELTSWAIAACADEPPLRITAINRRVRW